MSFGPSAGEKTAQQKQQEIADTAVANAGMATGRGTGLLNLGGQNVGAATNFFNTLLGGNAANTAAQMAPDLNRIRAQSQNAIQTLSTLMPRGGGRSGALFNASYAPTTAATNLFNTTRAAAAPMLANIGLAQTGQGTSLYGVGNQALGMGGSMEANLFDEAMKQRQMSNQLWGGLGGGLFNLAMTPFAGGKGLFGMFGRPSGTAG